MVKKENILEEFSASRIFSFVRAGGFSRSDC
jgi:hypothetical protein